uniref:Delta(3,5)-Delta(2,4)-dienoyl-CoA isomerase, mitochondrial n=1 Tax=Panagrellus redivivus TaxID=6233 RepID=A0A7E4VR63_PANRE
MMSIFSKTLSTVRGTAPRVSFFTPLSTYRQASSSRPFASKNATPPTLEHLAIEQRGNVFNLQLNRPKLLNAVTGDTWRELKIAFDYLHQTPACRVIVVTGNGRAFCAGLDLKSGAEFFMGVTQDESLDIARKASEIRAFLKVAQGAYSSIEACRKPVIAAVHGYALGAATSLITAADIRYATSDSILSIKEVDIAIAADVGVLQRIQKLVGNDSLTRELVLTARNFTGAEAKEYGLVSRTFPDKESLYDAAFLLADQIAAKSPVAVQGSKLALNYSRDHSVADSLEWMANWNISMLQSEDLIKAVMAASSKGGDPPKFNDF